MPLTVLDRQCAIDVAVESTGDFSRVFDTAIANEESVTWLPDPGEVALTVAPANERKSLLRVFADRSNAPASADLDEGNGENGGIGFMEIGNDFKVN